MGDDEENPYDVLGLQESATPAQIKQAYRKLALKHHPDKQTTEKAKQEAHVKFSKISHAYEILGDETRRREFDLSQQQQQYQGHHQDYHGAGYQDNFHFHDPFAVFEQVFAQEFGNHGRAFGGSHRQQQQQPMMDPFAGVGMGFGNVFGRDPFAGSGFGGGGGMFDNDPFFGGGGGGHHQGNAMDPFTQMRQQMHMMRQSQMDMMRQASQQQGGFNDGGGGGGSATSYSYSSSSSTSFGGGRGGQRESVSTSTRIVNGKRQTVTERVITKPDGSVERHVETSGDDDFPTQYAIDQDSQHQQRPQLENTTNSRRNSRRRWF